MTWPNQDDVTGENYQRADPPAPPPRRAPVLPVVLAAAVVMVLAVGIPVGVLLVRGTGGGSNADAEPVSQSESSLRVTPSGPPRERTSPSPAPTSPTPVAPARPEPANLTSGQASLRNALSLNGVNSASCRGYPAGEDVTLRVIASIECTIDDTDFEEPIYYYSFPDDGAVEEYLALRASEVDRRGDCLSGDEYDGFWTGDGSRLGRVVCVDNTKDGITYFKIVWSRDGTGIVAVIQHESPSVTYRWWGEHGAPHQFSG